MGAVLGVSAPPILRALNWVVGPHFSRPPYVAWSVRRTLQIKPVMGCAAIGSLAQEGLEDPNLSFLNLLFEDSK